jgi:hypothetical protein
MAQVVLKGLLIEASHSGQATEVLLDTQMVSGEDTAACIQIGDNKALQK